MFLYFWICNEKKYSTKQLSKCRKLAEGHYPKLVSHFEIYKINVQNGHYNNSPITSNVRKNSNRTLLFCYIDENSPVFFRSYDYEERCTE